MFDIKFTSRNCMIMGLALIDLVLWAKVSFWAMILAMGIQLFVTGFVKWTEKWEKM